MAILKALPGITVSVLTADSPDALIEYPCDEDSAYIPQHWRHKSTTNYLQCTPNKTFSFKLTVGPPYTLDCPMLAFIILLDGRDDGPAELCHPGDMIGGRWEYLVPGYELEDQDDQDGKTKLYEFAFTDLKTNDVHPNDLPAEDLDAMKQIGLLEILIYRHEDSRGMKTTLKTLTEVIQEVPEKIFKGQAISHSAKLKKGKKINKPEACQRRALLDGEEHPIGVFRFKYRSKEDLLKCFIIPRPPSPSPTPSPPPPLPRTFRDLDETRINAYAIIQYDKMEQTRRMLVRQRRKLFVDINFEALSENEKKKLAQDYFESHIARPVKREVGKAANVAAGQKRKRALISTETRMDNGKLLFELADYDEESTSAATSALAGRLEEEADDDVVFVSTRPTLRSRRVQRENAARKNRH